MFVTLGSNVEPEANLSAAVHLLSSRLTVLGVSRLYETAAVGSTGRRTRQADYLNAALLLETELTPAVLKFDVLRELELELGRVRTADKFGPRTIDLDIALYGDLVVSDVAGGIIIPDPDITEHPHVAMPLADLAPRFVHPTDGRTLAVIAASLANRSRIHVRGDLRLGWRMKANATLTPDRAAPV